MICEDIDMQGRCVSISSVGNKSVRPILILTFTVTMAIIVSAAESQAATLTITANNGSVTLTPQKDQYDIGETVELKPKPDTGYYFSGWAGDARGNRLVLNLTMDGDKSITASFDTWQPPIGIPAPEFGISETYRMYDDPAKRNPDLTYTQNAEGGYYTHYVDNTDPNATDSGNPYGTAGCPRNTIPRALPAGSVVEVHNGANANGFGKALIDGVGTAERPIFVIGVGMPRMDFLMEIGFYGNARYIIVEGISFFGGNILGRQDGIVFDTSHIARFGIPLPPFCSSIRLLLPEFFRVFLSSMGRRTTLMCQTDLSFMLLGLLSTLCGQTDLSFCFF